MSRNDFSGKRNNPVGGATSGFSSSPSTPTLSAKPAAKSGRKEVTREMIAKRAYEIYLSGGGGSDEENWYRAERDLRGS